jgi:hypothetical protein
MKAQILKIAGVKSEKEFYKKYPSEEAFMKVHGKAFKKAQFGAYIGGDTIANPKMVDFNALYDQADLTATGMTDTMRKAQAEKDAQAAAAAKQSGGGEGEGEGGMDAGNIMKALDAGNDGGGEGMDMLGGSGEGGGEAGGGLMDMLGGSGGESGGGLMEMLGPLLGGGENGINIPKAASGTNTNDWWSGMTTDTTTTAAPGFDINKWGIGAQTMGRLGEPSAPSNKAAGTPVDTSKENWMFKDTNTIPQVGAPSFQGLGGPMGDEPDSGLYSKLGGFGKLLGPVGGIIKGIDALKEESRAADRARQAKELSGLQLKASTTRPEERERKYVRPEDIANTGEAFFPIYGVGTNVLARNGMRLQGGGMIGGNPTEIQNTYGEGNSIYDDLGYEPLIDYDQQKSFRHGGYIPRMQGGGTPKETGWQRWQNSMAGKGSGFSGSTRGGAGAGDVGSMKGGSGGGATPWGAIGSTASGIANMSMDGGNAGGQIGSTIGGSIGSIFGPAGGAIGGFVGTIAGNALDPYQRRIKNDTRQTKRNVQNTAMNQMAPAIQAGYASHMKDGGWVSNDWQPQVIASFGDLTSEDYHRFSHKDEFRAGGHLREYTPPSERAMETYEDGGEITSYGMGGQLKTHWGGEAETMSYNPYLPGSGETVVFRGQSHTDSDGKGNTGIGITYGDSPVEVERGEPMFEMQSGGEINPETGEPENTGVVFGNMQIDKRIARQIDDPELMEIANKYHGKKFKNVGIDLSKQEAKQNKIIDKSSNELDSFQVNTAFDKLKLSSLRANIEGANLKLKGIADTKIALANYQNAINDTKDEFSDALGKNISAEHLAKGLIKIDKDPVTKDAKWGGNIVKKAQNGETTPKKTSTPKKTKEQLLAEGYTKRSDGTWRKETKGVKKPDREIKSATAMDTIPKQSVDKATGLFGGITPEQFKAYKEKNKWFTKWDTFDPTDPNDVDEYAKAFNAEAEKRGSKARILPDVEYDPKTKKSVPGTKTKYVGKQFTSADLGEERKSEEPVPSEDIAIEDVPDTIPESKSRFPWEIPANMIIDYLRPTDQEPLDYNQLMGEMYALSSNQLEPVQAQLYKPEIGIPYDISYQDILNENQADFRSTQRMMGYNPAAQAALDAQKYQANQKVLGEQFRANQAMKDQVYTNNRNTLNQAKLTNLGILDKQYERQSQAMSNTKATTQAALNSMSDKYAKNKLENRKLAIYENMYNYRFGKNGRARNYNGLQFFDTDITGARSRQEEEIPEGYKVTGYDKNKNPRLERITEKDMQEEEAALEAVGGIKGKNGASAKKNYKNSSVVKAYKNL